jgi:hypothetical protein
MCLSFSETSLSACTLIYDKILTSLGSYAAYSSDSVPTFRDNLTMKFSWASKSKKDEFVMLKSRSSLSI